MRLTLRTLLSWKDGMLDPEAARDIAARVESSDAARRLAKRIDEVATSDVLSAAAPDAAGFAADANTTAEYLDNALESGQLAEFERACFQSDSLLAETAATHETLASWCRDPAPELSASEGRRLLQAARGRGGADGDPQPRPPSRPAAPRSAVTASAARPVRSPRRAPVAAWLLVASAILLLATLVGVLGWSLTSGSRRTAARRDVAARRDADAVVASRPGGANAAPASDVTPADDVPADAPPAAPAGATVEPPSPEPPASVAPTAPLETSSPIEETAHVDPAMEPAAPVEESPRPPVAAAEPPAVVTPSPIPVAPPAEPGERRVPQGDALAIAAPAIPPPAAPAAAGAPDPQPVAAPAAAGQAKIRGPAVLLVRPSADAQAAWVAGAEGSPLDLPVELVAPPFCRPMLDVGGTEIVLEPGTRAALGRDADGSLRLEVVFGAAMVARGVRIGVTAGELAGVVATAAGAPVGVEVRLERGPGDAAESTRRLARIVPVGAPVEWRQTAADGGVRESPLVGIDAVSAVTSGQALAWRSDRPDAAAIEAAGPLPAWLTSRRAGDPLEQMASKSLTRRLAAGTVAVPALRELAADRRVESRLAAAATLAMLGEFDELARLISAEGAGGLRENEWERLDAVAVQPALARGPKAAEGLARALAAQGPPGAADTLLRLARGVDDEQLVAGGAADLVAALDSPHLVIRRYAIRSLVEIAGASGVERLQYRADWPDDSLRDKGIAWWRAQLERGRIQRGAASGGP